MIQAGTRLGSRYVLVEVVGRGDKGEVWRADDPMLPRVVAVKIFSPSLSGLPDFADRLRRQAQVLAALRDPNIVDTYDVGEADGMVYLVTEFVPGESLHVRLHRLGPYAPREAMELIAKAARGLHVAHSNGILHFDVRTSNILLCPDGRLVLTDFGIARVISGVPISWFVGTAPYIPPQQSDPTASPYVDIYALGVVAYLCLTLAHPFPGDNSTQNALMKARQDPPPLPPSIPATVRHVVMRALARDRRSGWLTAAEMGEAAAAAARAASRQE